MATIFEPMTEEYLDHRQHLIERLDSLRNNERLCDVIVEVKGKEFKAHKAVLAAASPFFLTLLESNMKEGNEHLIKIELEESTAPVMEDVLKYVYTGDVSVSEESAHNLIVTADYLLLPGLKSLACDFLTETLATCNCIFNYYFAEKYQCVNLKEECMLLINSVFSAVMETDDFLSLDAKQVMKWVSSDDVTVNAEEEIFKGIVKWVHHNKSEREKEFPDLLQQIRFISIHQDYLVNEMVKEELITTNIQCLNFVLGSLKWILNPSIESSIKPRACLQKERKGIFVCGGKKVMYYCPRKNIWFQLPNMMMEHQNHVAVQYRDRVYIFSDQKHADFYMPSANTWGAIEANLSIHSAKFCSSLILKEHKTLYTLIESHLRKCAIYSYDPVKSLWKCFVSHEKLQCWGACGVTDGCHLYLIGGSKCDDSGLTHGSTKVLKFDAEEDKYEEVASMSEARHDAFGAAMNGKIYVAGGLQVLSTLRTCEMYDTSTNEWQMMPDLNVPRCLSSMVCFQGSLFVVGGLRSQKRYSRELSVEMFDSNTNEWKRKSSIPIVNEREEERKKNWHYKACFATVHVGAFRGCKPIK